MTSDQIKKKMRASLMAELSAEERQQPYLKTTKGVLNADQIMEEVEADTEVGKKVLHDFTVFYETGEWPLSDSDLDQIADLMEQDIAKNREPGFADTTITVSNRGDARTPRQLVQEVRDRTVLGMEYAQLWADTNLVRVDLPLDTVDPLQVN